jgi:hypothetical protein
MQDVPHHRERLRFVQIRLTIAPLVVIDMGALQAERFVVRRERLRHTGVDEVTAALLQVMERNPDEADPLRQVGRAPRQTTTSTPTPDASSP